MSELRLILLCSSRFAIPAMRHLLFFKQLGLIAIPSHCEELIAETRAIITETDIPLLIVNRSNFEEELISAIGAGNITAGLILSFSFILPQSVYNLPPGGFFNVHPGPLPEYRGADPVFQQIKNREKFAGVTIHKLADGPDTGAIVIRQMIPLDAGDNYGILDAKLAQLAVKLVAVLIKLIDFGFTVPSRPQDESKAHYYERQFASDISIDWQKMDADTIIALINACNPWNKGAVTRFADRIIRLADAQKIENDEAGQIVPGTILSIDDEGMIVSTINGEALLLSIIYVDEGIFLAGRLRQFGVRKGMLLEKC